MKANFQIYKWGYFPQSEMYNLDDLFEKKHSAKKTSILWVGRLIKLKHPDASIKIAHKLKQAGYDFKLDIVGDGVLRPALEKLIQKYKLQDDVHLLGAIPSGEVRKYMERANIYLFTSDYHEGWGAVMNEAMNSGCAVVASHAVGSVPFLVKHGENGFVYKNGVKITITLKRDANPQVRLNQLYKHVQYLLDHPEVLTQIGGNAYRTITELWNSNEAAERLYQIIEAKLSNLDDCIYSDGPCSLATVIDPHYHGETI